MTRRKERGGRIIKEIEKIGLVTSVPLSIEHESKKLERKD